MNYQPIKRCKETINCILLTENKSQFEKIIIYCMISRTKHSGKGKKYGNNKKITGCQDRECEMKGQNTEAT